MPEIVYVPLTYQMKIKSHKPPATLALILSAKKAEDVKTWDIWRN